VEAKWVKVVELALGQVELREAVQSAEESGGQNLQLIAGHVQLLQRGPRAHPHRTAGGQIAQEERPGVRAGERVRRAVGQGHFGCGGQRDGRASHAIHLQRLVGQHQRGHARTRDGQQVLERLGALAGGGTRHRRSVPAAAHQNNQH